MVSDIIRFRETKEFTEIMREAEALINVSNRSDLIRILITLGLERLKESFKSIQSVTQPLKMGETEALASSIKIFLIKEKKEQIKELR